MLQQSSYSTVTPPTGDRHHPREPQRFKTSSQSSVPCVMGDSKLHHELLHRSVEVEDNHPPSSSEEASIQLVYQSL